MALSAEKSGVVFIVSLKSVTPTHHKTLNDVLQTLSRVREKENTETTRSTKPLSRPVSKFRGSPARRGAAATNGDTTSTRPQTVEQRTKKDVSEEYLLVGSKLTLHSCLANSISVNFVAVEAKTLGGTVFH